MAVSWHTQQIRDQCLLSESSAVGKRVERGSQFVIAFWHQIALDLHLADYSRTGPDGKEVMAPENPGPCYTSRSFAMTHVVMYDAYVGVTGEAATRLSYNKADLPKIKPGAESASLVCHKPLRVVVRVLDAHCGS